MEVGKYDWKKIDDDYPRLLSWEKTIGKKPDDGYPHGPYPLKIEVGKNIIVKNLRRLPPWKLKLGKKLLK